MAHAQYEFGKYLQAHEATDNTMKERTLDTIAMGPIGNRQGGFYALNLTTVTPLPTPQSVIDKLSQLAKHKNAPEGLVFGDRTNAMLLDDLAADLNADSDNDDDYASDPDYSDRPSANDDNSQITGVMDNDDDDDFFYSKQGDDDNGDGDGHDEGDEDGIDELDDNNGEISGVEVNNGNEKDYDFSPNNDPYEDSNNDYDQNSNNEIDLESNDGTNPGMRGTTTRSGRANSKPSIMNGSSWKGKTYEGDYGKSEPDMEVPSAPTTVLTQTMEIISKKILSQNMSLRKTQLPSIRTTATSNIAG